MNDCTRAVGPASAVSLEMQAAIDLWADLFLDRPPWQDTTTQSCGLAAAIAGECARLTVVELKAEVTGSERAKYLAQEFAPVLRELRPNMELACATGCMVFKPYFDGRGLAVDCVPAWRFRPIAFNSRREVTAAVFTERVVVGKRWYTRMEYHRLTNSGYRVDNLAFCSISEATLGQPCDLQEVEAWQALEPEVIFRYADGAPPERMLFALFRVPWANNLDPESPMGVSVYSRAVNLLREADRQYSRILWEYEGSELAVHASEGALRASTMPKRRQRLFRELRLDGGDRDLYHVFSPQIRDSSLFNGLNQLLRRIEFNCNLAYGTLSDPQNVAKTAEEVKGSRQRSYSAICELQEALEQSLHQLLWVMDFYCSLYHLAPEGGYRAQFLWGDGVQEDADAEFARRKELADGGYLRPEKLVAWYFHISEEEAAAYLPAPQLAGAERDTAQPHGDATPSTSVAEGKEHP